MSQLVQRGVSRNIGVTVDGSTMVVTVGAGVLVFDNVAVAVAQQTVTLGAADPTNARYDLIGIDSGGLIHAVAGTPDSNPVYPDSLPPTVNTGYVWLAAVQVPAGATALVSGNVTDLRTAPQTTTSVGYVTPDPGQLIKRSVFTSGSGTLTFQPSTVTVRIVVVGGGGGGGGVTAASGASAAAGGGGGGGTCDVVVAVGSNTSLTYSVGAGGAGGTGGVGTGGTGGDSTCTLGATTYTAHGGAGGQDMAFQTTATVGVSGGAGGTASGGDLNIQGSYGTGGWHSVAGSPGLSVAGSGGASQWGGGGASSAGAPGDGQAGGSYGGGGAGATSVGIGAHTGGAGGKGCVFVEEYT